MEVARKHYSTVVELAALGSHDDPREAMAGGPPGQISAIATDLTARLDAWAGDRIEAVAGAQHRRRLRRADRLDQLDPPRDGRLWAAGIRAVRDGCALEVLVDGAQALPRIAEAIAGARRHVHVAGWHATPGFGLTRDEHALPLR